MAPEDERLYLLLDRYLAGDASAADAAAVREWLAQDSGHVLLLDDLRLIRRAAAERAPTSRTDGAWAKAGDALGVAPQARVSRRVVAAGPFAPAPPPPPRGGAGPPPP